MSKEYEEFQQLLKQKRFREAAEFAEKENAHEEGQNVFWITQQSNALRRGAQYEAALDSARSALALEATNPYAVRAAADALFGLERFDEAIDYYRETSHNPKLKARSLRRVLECLLKEKKWQTVLTDLEHGNYPAKEALQFRAKALRGLGQYPEAAAACREWLKLEPDNPSALWEQTEVEIALNGIESVMENLSRLARIPSLPPVYGEIYASLCGRAGKPQLAVKLYEKLESTGSDRRIQAKRAFALAKSGRELEAMDIFEELLKIDPGDIYLHSSYGAACRRMGEIERSINFYNLLLSMHPSEKGLYGRISRMRRVLENQR